MKKQFLLCACPAVFALAAGCSSASGGNSAVAAPVYQEDAMRFDRAKWVDEVNAYKVPYPRQQMMKSLKADTLKIGMPKAEVIALLGEKTKTDKFASHGLVYWIGPEPGAISIDSQWLVIDFDSKDALKSFDLVTD
jgi:outer membrane protein assembly factor BamE (lipoprotein component of BamABCDE complex)